MPDDRKPTDPAAIVIPFGKHKGATVAELLARDPAYADWITAQAWVAERFAELHAAILTRGAGTDDSPEHNALQARFLDERFRTALLRCAAKDWLDATRFDTALSIFYGDARRRGVLNHENRWDFDRTHDVDGKLRILGAVRDDVASIPLELFTKAIFESNGVDVMVVWDHAKTRNEAKLAYVRTKLNVELKPSMGDDFPSIMRQMRRLEATVLVVGAYTGRGASEPQMRAMFAASGITVVFVQEIEEAMRHDA